MTNLNEGTPQNLAEIEQRENQIHSARFIAALSISACATTLACVWKPAVIAAIPTYGWAIYEARKVRELNNPSS